jgi:hypothetical protein
MRNKLVICTISILVFGCSREDQITTKTTEKEASNRITFLEKENERKDSILNQSLLYYNEIQTNLEAMHIKEEGIRVITTDNELNDDTKKWIIAQIKHINFLRQENAKKLSILRKTLKNKDLTLTELNTLVQKMADNIQFKDEQISVLQGELGSVDIAYSKLFDAYQEKAIRVEELTNELNKAYYTYGTEKELVKNKVIERKNGFIGIGKKINLSQTLNANYFAEIDLSKEKEVFIEGKNIRFVTDHPNSSYQLQTIGKNTKIKITNSREFWKVTKYLVILID